MSLEPQEEEKLKDLTINSTLMFLDKTVNPPRKRKLFFVIGCAFSKERGYGGKHSFVKHNQEFPNIISSLPQTIQKFALNNTRTNLDKSFQNFKSVLLYLPFILKYWNQAPNNFDPNKICVLYKDSFSVLAKLVKGAFKGGWQLLSTYHF